MDPVERPLARQIVGALGYGALFTVVGVDFVRPGDPASPAWVLLGFWAGIGLMVVGWIISNSPWTSHLRPRVRWMGPAGYAACAGVIVSYLLATGRAGDLLDLFWEFLIASCIAFAIWHYLREPEWAKFRAEQQAMAARHETPSS